MLELEGPEGSPNRCRPRFLGSERIPREVGMKWKWRKIRLWVP